MSQAVVIRKSKIAGEGVFATRDFKKGEAVLIWHPKILTKAEFDITSKEEKHFIYKVGNKYLSMQPPEKYVNHSCDSNTKTDGFKDVAVRDIKNGEEITADYSNDGVVTFKCNCGSKKCRGLVS